MNYCKYEIYFFLLLAILVALSSCTNSSSQVFNQYFDAKTYVEQEKDELLKDFKHYNNTIILNGNEETKQNELLDTIVVEELVDYFSKANINKKINQDQYKIDTFWMLDAKTNENIEVLNYSTTNKKLDVKWFQQYSNGSMKALLSKSNFLYSYEKEIFYGKEDEFSVVSWQKILGQDTLRVFSKVEFIP
ncbi:MAG: hypothetical protein KDE33_03760 [Bacteroidetes bacterium]|nr:hypothetical protein [Bacteroidota bacterium]MCB9226848.1 hypothetical protein [Chitinophagales bacterium]